MATTHNASNEAQRAEDKKKEVAGKLTGNDELPAEGGVDQTKGNPKRGRARRPRTASRSDEGHITDAVHDRSGGQLY
jgi:uncharacterized protein YjbJ (UPF0337 family)